MTNPFAQPAAAPVQPAAPAANPYAQPAAPAAVPANPFGTGVPAQPAYQSAAPQAYAPAQPAATVPQGPPPALNMGGLASAPPPAPDGARGAKLADMYGRLTLIFPLSITRQQRNAKFITPEQRQRGDLEQDRLVATVVVLDDGQGGMQPIGHGGAPYALPPVAHTESSPLPYVRKAMWITQTKLIEQLRSALPTTPGGAPGMICGRVIKAGPAQNDPWYLQGATEGELGLAGQYLQLVQAGTCEHPLA